MENIYNICNNCGDKSSPLVAKINCKTLAISQNDIELYVVPYGMETLLTSFETFNKKIAPSTFEKIDINSHSVFYFLKTNVPTNAAVIYENDITKVDMNLLLTPPQTLVLGAEQIAYSYLPIIQLPDILENLTMSDFSIDVTDSLNNSVDYILDWNTNTLEFKDMLMGNESYTIIANILVRNEYGDIINTQVLEYSFFVTKKKLQTYDYVSVINDSIIDIDNDIKIIIPDIPNNLILENIEIDIEDVDFNIKSKEIILDVDTSQYNLEININIIGLLTKNTNYSINVSNITNSSDSDSDSDSEGPIFLDEYEPAYTILDNDNVIINFKTNMFHGCVAKNNFSSIVLYDLFVPRTDEHMYILNNSNDNMLLTGIIGNNETNIQYSDPC